MTKVGFISLGCSKNQVDTEVMIRLVKDAGYEIVAEDIQADIMVINTCGFLQSAVQEAIDNILDVAWLKKNRQLKGIVVTGCMAERYREEEIFRELPEVDACIGIGSIQHIVEAIQSVEEKKKKKYFSFDDKNTSPLGGNRILTTPPYTVYMKIAEGCDNCCTYCAIPSIRGKFRSRPIEDLVAEAKQLESTGALELNLIAQDTSRYGLDLYGKYSLADLVRAICRETSIPWIRLLYCYPDKIDDDLIEELKNNPRLLPYMDIPIQHISDPILKAMNRHGDAQLIKDTIRKLREEVPGITLRTTAIVGFPGETEEQFTELCDFIKETRFDRFGAFTYSQEPETPACDFPDQIEEQVKQDRYDVLMASQLRISEELQNAKIGSIVEVLCEGYDRTASVYFGRSKADAPDVDGKVFFSSGKQIQPGTFVRVKITESMDYDLLGKIVRD